MSINRIQAKLRDLVVVQAMSEMAAGGQNPSREEFREHLARKYEQSMPNLRGSLFEDKVLGAVAQRAAARATSSPDPWESNNHARRHGRRQEARRRHRQ
mmetsp:Transcript_122353/g.391443  ORF Transcript_122353/g.391443 Transcript_122353/m.391443 type:complete len:99 (+) Transcript_122353:186-482(+)